MIHSTVDSIHSLSFSHSLYTVCCADNHTQFCNRVTELSQISMGNKIFFYLYNVLNIRIFPTMLDCSIPLFTVTQLHFF